MAGVSGRGNPDYRQFDGLIGLPFVDGGRDPERDGGLDCWGLVRLARSRFGLSTPDYAASAFQPSAIISTAALALCSGRWVDLPGPVPGAVVMFALEPNAPEAVQHFGTCLDSRFFLQTLVKTGSALWRLNHPFFASRIKGYRQWNPGL